MNEQPQKNLNKVREELRVALERRDMARREAAHAEERNARTLAEGKATATKEGLNIIAAAKGRANLLEEDISKLTDVKSGLMDEIEALNISKAAINKDSLQRESKRDELDGTIMEYNQKLTELDIQLVNSSEDLRDYRGKVQALYQDIHDLEITKERAQQDLDVLNDTIDETENRIMDLDATFKDRKQTLEIQIAEVQRKLNAALANLVETENKDKSIRENWADEHRRLDKRTQAVRHMEAKLSDSEARIQELDNYMKL